MIVLLLLLSIVSISAYDITQCKSTMSVGVFDYVIPLWDPKDPALNRTLRSFEKNGLLDVVRNVYVIVSKEHAAEDLQNMFSGIEVVKIEDIDIPFDLTHVHIKMIKHFAAPYIDGISDNYMMGPDDTILNSKFRKEYIFNTEKQLPYFHSFGSDLIGRCMGFSNIAPGHGPNLINKCAMKYIIESYHDVKPAVDPVCVYAGILNRNNMLADIYSYHDRRFRKVAGIEYFSECHTNGNCKRPGFDDLFVNIQGDGISIEYRFRGREHDVFSKWFEQKFPTPSRFEKLPDTCEYEHQCTGCTTCVNNLCMAFDEGENCIPDNHVDIKRDLELYYEFYYLQSVSIEEYRCLPFGVSVRFVKGLSIESYMSEDYFNKNYMGLIERDCEGWGYIYTTNTQ
jgi:hypothetical protein